MLLLHDAQSFLATTLVTLSLNVSGDDDVHVDVHRARDALREHDVYAKCVTILRYLLAFLAAKLPKSFYSQVFQLLFQYFFQRAAI